MRTPLADYYAILGVARSASEEDLRRAFRALALEHHPDRAGPESTTTFQAIAEAYAVLSEPAARANYDASVATYRQTTLTAFQQVEDYLAATRILSQQIIKQQQAVDSSKQYLDLEMQRYQMGVDPYIDVTVAQTTLLGNQQTLATLQVQVATASVELVQRR